MILSSGTTDFASGALGMVETAAGYLHDRTHSKWSKAEIIHYVNLSQLSVANKINSLYQEFFVTAATTPSSGTGRYALPEDLIKLWGIDVGDGTDDEKTLKEIQLRHRDFYRKLGAANDISEFGYFFVMNKEFELRPEDASTGTSIEVFYVRRLTDMSLDAEVSEIPKEHHELVVTGAVIRAMVKTNQRNARLDKLHSDLLLDLKVSVENISMTQEDEVVPYLDLEPNLRWQV
jgi:hypothetical protein